MKAFQLARAFGAGFALVLVGAIVGYSAVVLPLPSASGPTLGDPTTNLYSVVQGLQNNQYTNYFSVTSIDTTSGQANCTQLTYGMTYLTQSLSGTGYVCLPTAKPGTETFIFNNTGQTVDIYGSATTAQAGVQDNINGTVGTSAYAGMTNGKNADCFVPALGNWACSSGN
jgi:hypothetical protein